MTKRRWEWLCSNCLICVITTFRDNIHVPMILRLLNINENSAENLSSTYKIHFNDSVLVPVLNERLTLQSVACWSQSVFYT